MPRISEIDPTDAPIRVKAVLDAQEERYGAPLNNHLLYARNTEVFRGVRAMWSALDQDGVIDTALASIVNRRVAALIGCVF